MESFELKNTVVLFRSGTNEELYNNYVCAIRNQRAGSVICEPPILDAGFVYTLGFGCVDYTSAHYRIVFSHPN